MSLVSHIGDETNRYAEQSLQGTGKEWSTNAEEIRAYFGFMIFMGINRLPEIRDYWCNSECLHYSPITDRITRDRFEQITRFLHIADDDTLPARGGYFRLQEVDPVISTLKENFRTAYYPNREVCIDDAIIPFKGRSSMKQYVPLKPKPVKCGFKV